MKPSDVNFYSLMNLIGSSVKYQVVASQMDCILVKNSNNGHIAKIPTYPSHYRGQYQILNADHLWELASNHYENWLDYLSDVDIFVKQKAS